MIHTRRHMIRHWLLRAGSLVLAAGILLGSSSIPAYADSEEEKPALVILEQDDQDVRRDMQTKLQLRDETEAQIIPSIKISADKKDFTVMIYMVGSDLESRNAAATGDLMEIADSGVDFKKTNVIVYAGGTRRWNTNVPVTQNSVLDMSRAEDDRIVAATESNADMGAPACLANFINFCETNYPADHYGLILWDHGGGPIYGYGFDELYGSDSLLLQEMKSAMASTSFSSDHPLDFVGFDACLMGTLETAVIWQDYARYLIASEETESGPGWDYHFLSTLNKTTDAQEISKTIVDTYAAYYEAHKTWSFDPDTTLSVTDLSLTSALQEAFDQLVGQIQKDFSLSDYAVVRRAASQAKGFGLTGLKSLTDAYDLLDLYSFCEQLQEQYPKETASIEKALAKAVLVNYSNVQHANGLAFYFPYYNRTLATEKEPLDEVLTGDYESLVDSYVAFWDQGTQVDWNLAKPTADADGIHLKLTPDQVENADTVTYTLMSHDASNYTFLLCNVAVEIDKNGVVSIPADPILFSAVIDSQESPDPWQFIQKQSTEEGQTYTTINANLMNGGDFFELSATNPQKISLMIRHDTEGIHILDVVSDNGTALISEKDSINVDRYTTIVDGPQYMYNPVWAADGTLKPYYEWEWNGFSYNTIPIDHSFSIVEKHASDYDYAFSGQFLIQDINGNIHATDLAELPAKAKTIETVATAKGSMKFEIADDHATLISYEGEDEAVEIPAQVKGLPVTRVGEKAFYYGHITKAVIPGSVTSIGPRAFLGCHDLTEVQLNEGLEILEFEAFGYCGGLTDIQLPSTVKSIGSEAFENCSFTSVHLPDGLEFYGNAVFSTGESLKEILISDSNPNFTSVDGVLFTKDQKTILQYPMGKGTSYEIPKGTETIGIGAFINCDLRQVVFPEGLTTIRSCAFLGVQNLEGLALPESLVEIGAHAFQGEIPYSGKIRAAITDEKALGNVSIGPNVEYIGESAFTNRNIQSFSVDEKNAWYSSYGGFITDLNHTVIIEAPCDAGAIIEIPDGITTLNADVFAGIPVDTDYIIPDSVYMISKNAFNKSYNNGDYVYRQKIHCSEGSAAETYAKQYGFTYDNSTDTDDMKHETITVVTDAGSMIFDVSSKEAILYYYEGNDEVLIVPDQVSGRPVTKITGFDVLRNKCNAREIYLPASLEWIDPEALVGFFYKAQILHVPETSKSFKVIDNVLFSHDGKELLAYPGGKPDTVYTVPDKTKIIGDHAFANNSNVVEVILPSSVETIKRYAFSGAYDLESVKLNEGLKRIEDSGLLTKDICSTLPSTVTYLGETALSYSKDPKDLVLPPNLEYIGWHAIKKYGYDTDLLHFGQTLVPISNDMEVDRHAYTDLWYSGFDVPKDDPTYKAVGPFLMDKSGAVLIICAPDTEEDIYVPEGTKSIAYWCFEQVPMAKRIYIPDSVTEISHQNVENEDVVFYVHANSPLISYLEDEKLTWAEWK